MHAPRTFLAPGQGYAEPLAPAWRHDRQVTVVRLDRDADGIPWVVSRCPGGQEVVVYAAEVEAAIAAGQLVPVVGPGRIARC